MSVAITITFSESVENNTGMEILGKKEKIGFNIYDLLKARKRFRKLGVNCEIYDLTKGVDVKTADKAYILVARNAIDVIGESIGKNTKDMLKEQLTYKWDTKTYSRKHKSSASQGVVEKRARHNVCYAEVGQEPDILNKKGTVIPFNQLPFMNHIREELPKFLGSKGKDLLAEGNKYYNIKSCGIGFHGDTERSKVIGIRLGSSHPLHYQWYERFKPVGKRMEFILNSGDLYIMSEKAVGNDWKRSSILTLRHSAGSKKYTNPKNEKLQYVDIEILRLTDVDLIGLFCNDPTKENFRMLDKVIRIIFIKFAKIVLKKGKGKKKLASKILLFSNEL